MDSNLPPSPEDSEQSHSRRQLVRAFKDYKLGTSIHVYVADKCIPKINKYFKPAKQLKLAKLLAQHPDQSETLCVDGSVEIRRTPYDGCLIYSRDNRSNGHITIFEITSDRWYKGLGKLALFEAVRQIAKRLPDFDIFERIPHSQSRIEYDACAKRKLSSSSRKFSTTLLAPLVVGEHAYIIADDIILSLEIYCHRDKMASSLANHIHGKRLVYHWPMKEQGIGRTESPNTVSRLFDTIDEKEHRPLNGTLAYGGQHKPYKKNFSNRSLILSEAEMDKSEAERLELLREAMEDLQLHIEGKKTLKTFIVSTEPEVDIPSILQELDYTPEQLASALGISPRLLEAWMNDEEEIPLDFKRLLSLIDIFSDQAEQIFEEIKLLRPSKQQS